MLQSLLNNIVEFFREYQIDLNPLSDISHSRSKKGFLTLCGNLSELIVENGFCFSGDLLSFT